MAAFLPAAITAAGAIGGGYLSGRSSGSETKMQRMQRKFLDQLIASLSGQGPYSDLYNFDEASFQKSFVEPAKAMYKNTDKFFTPDIMTQLEKVANEKFAYGGDEEELEEIDSEE